MNRPRPLPQDDATLRQIAAADPRASTWLSANAGSGKTRVLTDRVARLLLDGTSPQNILCLTYTKAAASEMQNRLFRRLGEWSMADDADLAERLTALGVDGPLDADRLAAARRLFARAIETPGGLRIQTIHSFCAVLLRRFPLEAGVTPQFTEMDDRAAALLRAECMERLALDEPAPLDDLARHFTGDTLDLMGKEIADRRDDFRAIPDETALRALLSLPPGIGMDAVPARVFDGMDADLLPRIAAIMAASGGKTDAKLAPRLAAIVPPFTVAHLEVLEDCLLTGDGAKQPFSAKIGAVPTKAVQAMLGDDLDALNDLMLAVQDARDLRLGLLALDRTLALHRFAAAFLPVYERGKAARGWLDFDDLILKARDLLTDPQVAAWVLFRLDGGIDHILVDEAQDTSPAQWEVIEALAQEFAAGHGVRRAGERTLFVVGDRKQSIYSFQGADPTGFELRRDRFARRLKPVSPLVSHDLLHSFRSSEAILSVVDRVFADTPGMGTAARHIAFHTALPGRVDLWPLVRPEAAPEPPAFDDPVDVMSPVDASVRLGRAVAQGIRQAIDGGATIPLPDGTRRPVTEGDFLILVRSRRQIFRQIILACKAEGLNIAGSDRLKLQAERAVRDIRALLAFLATPEDDLSLATALRSPLCGWTEGELFTLAANRPQGAFLWQALRRSPMRPDTRAMLDDLRRNADYLRPYDLIERILLRHGGRSALLARLGDEAEDGIDELLTQAMAYERADIPSLTGFLAWFDAADVEAKRQAEGRGSRIRVMTVHGAKGLEAPIVILPETMKKPRESSGQIVVAADAPPLWKVAKAQRHPVLGASVAAQEQAAAEERDRLLYVAMTRAETWLIVCGAGDDKDAPNLWYGQVAAALDALDTDAIDTPTGPGRRFAVGDWDKGCAVQVAAATDAPSALPDWIRRPAPPATEPPRTITPSDLGGEKALRGPAALDAADAKRRGTLIHALLEHLPPDRPADWPGLAPRLLVADPPLTAPEITALLDEARGVLAAPALRDLLGEPALAEVELVARLGDRPLSGIVDRLILRDGAVLAIDYKSNAVVPATPAEVPEGLLRQMGAYLVALRQIYPDRRVDVALLWTRTASLMPLPHDVVLAALDRWRDLDAPGGSA
ncbi:double-strand break repair helicase AddA [Oceaniovalibus guishaninsula JLT2003]|uniref:DNA 3'-5' helicase n=1 Tax=Oceaniovalibus guishaninsula JLT2003 TaxID=1231392 RepID=K2HB53_9RHOB|nr:double-strand break repair helicase AddA [Oceaniovalibus guishaninsula]EKE44688.1 double-strand break repair helicase AddA [Oceaniovalibus guishaninsula JLT2003]